MKKECPDFYLDGDGFLWVWCASESSWELVRNVGVKAGVRKQK